jgi:hypothetical protein
MRRRTLFRQKFYWEQGTTCLPPEVSILFFQRCSGQIPLYNMPSRYTAKILPVLLQNGKHFQWNNLDIYNRESVQRLLSNPQTKRRQRNTRKAITHSRVWVGTRYRESFFLVWDGWGWKQCFSLKRIFAFFHNKLWEILD